MAVLLFILLAVNLLQISWACPEHTKRPEHTRLPSRSEPYGYNLRQPRPEVEEIRDMLAPVVTLATIKAKLKETGIFDPENTTLTEREQKELRKLFDTVEIMVRNVASAAVVDYIRRSDLRSSSRARQPSSVQSVFSSLRMVERVVKKQERDGQVSKTLADKFHWNNLPSLLNVPPQVPQTTERRMYRFDKQKKIRIFNLHS